MYLSDCFPCCHVQNRQRGAHRISFEPGSIDHTHIILHLLGNVVLQFCTSSAVIIHKAKIVAATTVMH